MPSSVGLGGTEKGGVAGEKRGGTLTMAELAGGARWRRTPRKAPDVTIQIKRGTKRHRPDDPNSIATEPLSGRAILEFLLARPTAGTDVAVVVVVRRILHYVLSLHKFISRRKRAPGRRSRSA